MKVLFAVNDDNISASIVKKYQKEYKEIISYKNVYYFNAILTELQRNKNYDRIVISEDLEEFTSSSYEQKDKFIFDKLDNISDEGTDIPIILICSERRSKSEDILVKLFGISIYNAVIGNDRSIDEICRLINRPRSKKEAKIYYKIDTDDVNYEREKEIVGEDEINNILIHFKKIGKNETRYVESFNNIASQYNDEQLKIIITYLPNSVKDVLKEYSPEYQRIVYPNGISEPPKENQQVRYTQNKKTITSPTGRLLKVDSQERMSKPVVIPTDLEKNMYQQVTAKKVPAVDLNQFDDLTDEDEFEEEPVAEEKPKKRGRPRKNPLPKDNGEESAAEEKPKRRGRPKKNPTEDEEDEENMGTLPGFEDDTSNVLPGFFDETDDNELGGQSAGIFETVVKPTNNQLNGVQLKTIDPTINTFNSINAYNEETEEYDNLFDDNFDKLLINGNKRLIAFVGTSKNGTSFIVNNIAQILSEVNVNTAILDTTKNRNSYYIYTKNDEELRNIATNSIENTINGMPQGVRVNNSLTVYTGIPSKYEEIRNSRPILENIVSNHTLILMDCDFKTPIEYFDRAQELYLIQSMDVLTIQPLTEFLRELKVKSVLDENKIRIILNKFLNVKGVNGRSIIGGMSKYNDPEMSFMTELFNVNIVKVAGTVPFDEDVYIKYLENMIECEMKTNGYPKDFKLRLNELAKIIYPEISSYSSNSKKNKKDKKQEYTNSFSTNMNSTLDDMRKRY